MRDDDKVVFIKQVSQHPRHRLAQKTRDDDKLEFVKQVPQHLRDRLAQKTRDDNKVDFVKQLPHYLRGRPKRTKRNMQIKKKLNIRGKNCKKKLRKY